MSNLHKVIWTEQKVSSFWDNTNLLINQSLKTGEYFGETSGPYLIKAVNRIIPLNGKAILDYGCGQGHIISELCKRYSSASIYGLDLSMEAVRDAEFRNKQYRNFKGAFQLNDTASIENSSIDIVLLTEVAEHMSNEEFSKTLSFISKLLHPDGYIVVTVPNDQDLREETVVCPDCGCYFHAVQHVQSWSKQSLSFLWKIMVSDPIE